MRRMEKGLLLECILSFCLAILIFYVAGIRNSIFLLFMPFDLIGRGLRSLSLGSFVGNIAALLFYLVLSLVPIIYLIGKKIKSGLKPVDMLLPIISIYSFYMIYEFINPNFMLNRIPEMLADASMLPLLKLSFAIIFYTLCIGYLILRMIGTLTTFGSEDKLSFLCKRLRRLLIIISILETFLLGYFTTFQMFDKFSKYSSQDSVPINYIFVVITYLLKGLPIIFSILILIKGILLLEAMTSNHMKEEEFKAATQMGLISKRAVYVTFLCNITLNILQFLLSRQLSDTDYSLQISLFPLIIAFIAMILSGYFKETKKLQEDNEMII